MAPFRNGALNLRQQVKAGQGSSGEEEEEAQGKEEGLKETRRGPESRKKRTILLVLFLHLTTLSGF